MRTNGAAAARFCLSGDSLVDCRDEQNYRGIHQHCDLFLRRLSRDSHVSDACLSLSIGGTNHHPGNKRYRKMVEDRKVDYINSKRLDKPLVALEIIKEWRSQEPPGRFLKIDEKTGLWHDVGDKKARGTSRASYRF